MYSCPACGADKVASLDRCHCGTDLTLLRKLAAIPDAWFNRGLEALAAGRRGLALEWLSACCVARPTDGEARRTSIKVWAQLGCFEEARDALDRAAELEPDDPELREIRQALESAQAVASAPRSAGKTGDGGKSARTNRSKGAKLPATKHKRRRKQGSR
jgi:tetratricopeptide (TPR) repeat protein